MEIHQPFCLLHFITPLKPQQTVWEEHFWYFLPICNPLPPSSFFNEWVTHTGVDLVVHAAGPFQRRAECAVLEAALDTKVQSAQIYDDIFDVLLLQGD